MSLGKRLTRDMIKVVPEHWLGLNHKRNQNTQKKSFLKLNSYEKSQTKKIRKKQPTDIRDTSFKIYGVNYNILLHHQ